MTLEEAIIKLEETIDEMNIAVSALNSCFEQFRNDNVAKSILASVQSYAVGCKVSAYKDCLQLLKEVDGKEKPMETKEDVARGLGHCPNCGEIISRLDKGNYCPHCGQRLDWKMSDEASEKNATKQF